MFKIPKILDLQLQKKLPVPGKTGVDWFLYCYFISYFKNKSFLELGVGDGGSLLSMLAFSNNITAIDNWNYNWDKEPISELISSLNKEVKFIDSDTNSLNLNDLKAYHFIHLDANKSFDGTLNDLTICSQISKGIICIDDYMNSMWPEVTWAVDSFLKKNKDWKIVLIGNHQIFISKVKINLKKIILEFPVVLRNEVLYLTYGKLPIQVKAFCNAEYITYTWNSIAWDM